MEFNYENQIPFYLDYYNLNDFGQDYNQITDIDIFQENLYVTTDSGVFVANFIQDNLNFSSSWTKIPFDAFIGEQIIKYYIELKMDFIYLLLMNCIL